MGKLKKILRPKSLTERLILPFTEINHMYKNNAPLTSDNEYPIFVTFSFDLHPKRINHAHSGAISTPQGNKIGKKESK